MNPLTERLKYHVTGAIERGEKQAIVEQRAAQQAAHTPDGVFEAFRRKHATALNELRGYALDDQLDADRLNPVIQARSLAEMVEHAPNLYRNVPCSVFIDELYHELLSLAVSNSGCPDPRCVDGVIDSGGFTPWGEAISLPCPSCNPSTQ